jgi:hypothetical protein
MGPSLENALVTASIAAGVSLIVAVFSPLFTHHLWKRQKRKEQQLALAERYSALMATSTVIHKTFRKTSPPLFGLPEEEEPEFRRLLFVILVLFQSTDVVGRAGSMLYPTEMGKSPALVLDEPWEIFVTLQGYLFAEALDVPFEKVPPLPALYR